MFRHVSPVLREHVSEIGGLLDPTAPGRGAHLTFDRILARCGEAWMAFLAGLGGFGVEIICPRIEVDYLREVGAGDLVLDVQVLSVGRSSFRLRIDLTQHGEPVADAEVVLVAFDYVAGSSVPLTEGQRSALETHLAP
jgi:acyl-CoA thioesterase FadM